MIGEYIQGEVTLVFFGKLIEQGETKPRRKRRGSNGHRTYDPAKVAGPKALKTTEQTMKDLGTAAQAEVTRRTDLNSGSVSYALRALGERGIVRKTGAMDGRSPVWEYVGSEDGTGDSTKVAPGT